MSGERRVETLEEHAETTNHVPTHFTTASAWPSLGDTALEVNGPTASFAWGDMDGWRPPSKTGCHADGTPPGTILDPEVIHVGDVNVAALVPLGVLIVALVGYCWIDIARGEVQHLPKWAWVLISGVTIPFGPILYLTIGRVPRSRSHPR